MSLTAFAMSRYDSDLAVGCALSYGPTAGVRASLSPSPPIAPGAGTGGWSVRRHADGAIDFDAYRTAAATERADILARLIWAPLHRLLRRNPATTVTLANPSTEGDEPCLRKS